MPVDPQIHAILDILAAAGAPTIKRRYDGAIHGFYRMTGRVDIARRLIDDLGRDVMAMLSRPAG